MARRTTYQAARTVATTVETYFIHHTAEALQRDVTQLPAPPSAKVIETIIDVAFWASLRREEGHSPRISLAFLPPDLVQNPLLFEQRLPLTPGMLIKLSPGVERPGIHLGVWQEQDELYVWGATKEILPFCFVLDVPEPGLLVVKHRRIDGAGKFVNIAVLTGDQVKLVDEKGSSLPDCPALLTTLLDFTSPSWSNSVNVLVQLAVSMRAHKRGGSLLVVPAASEDWRASIIRPITYPVIPFYNGLTELMREDEQVRSQSQWQGKLQREVDSIASLTAIDGATIINDQLEVLAFGAKIGRREGYPPVGQLVVSEPVVGGTPATIHPSQNGGTRHLSATQFVHDQRNALALVASQDGRFTIFTWSPCDEKVHAHRIDALLL